MREKCGLGHKFEFKSPGERKEPTQKTRDLMYPQRKPLQSAAVLKRLLRPAPLRKEPEDFRAN